MLGLASPVPFDGFDLKLGNLNGKSVGGLDCSSKIRWNSFWRSILNLLTFSRNTNVCNMYRPSNR